MYSYIGYRNKDQIEIRDDFEGMIGIKWCRSSVALKSLARPDPPEMDTQVSSSLERRARLDGFLSCFGASVEVKLEDEDLTYIKSTYFYSYTF